MENETCKCGNENDVTYSNYSGKIMDGKIEYPIKPQNPEDVLSTSLYVLDQMLNYYTNFINHFKDCEDSIIEIQKTNEKLKNENIKLIKDNKELKQEIETLKSRIKLLDSRNERVLTENMKLQVKTKKYQDTAKNLYNLLQKYEEYFNPSHLNPEELFDEAQKEYDTTLDSIPSYAKQGMSDKNEYEPKLNTEQVKNKAKSEGQELIGWLADLIDSTFGQNWFDYNTLAETAKKFKSIKVK